MFRPGSILLFLLCLVFSSVFVPSSYAQSNCANYKFATNQIFTCCNDLPYLNSSLHWNYDHSSNTVEIAYRHTGITSSRWVAWAINPTGLACSAHNPSPLSTSLTAPSQFTRPLLLIAGGRFEFSGLRFIRHFFRKRDHHLCHAPA